MASFQDNLARPIVECQIILHFAAAGDDGTPGGGNNQNYKMMQSSNHITTTYVPTLGVFYRLDTLPVTYNQSKAPKAL